MRVVVTRPLQEARQWVNALADAGYDAVALPLIGVLPPDDRAAVVNVWSRLDSFDAVMFVSGNAVDHFFALRPASVHPIFASANGKPRMFVTGPGSLSALKRAQVDLRRIDMPDREGEQFDSEALWAVVAQQVRPGFRCLVVRGTASHGSMLAASDGVGRDWFADQVRAAGGHVEFVVSYQRRLPEVQPTEHDLIRQAAHDGSVWLFSSSEAIANLVLACPDQSWSQAKAVVTHSRIAQAARDAGFSVVCESRPTLAALMASIESIA